MSLADGKAPPAPIASAGPEAIARAAELLRNGGLVAFPTETVYGLGADATNDAAVARVFRVKGRPPRNPLIVHIPDDSAAEELAIFDDRAHRLARRFWPGALTLVLPRNPDSRLANAVAAGLGTVALRAPNHPVALDLLRQARVPLAAPSANISGRVSPTDAAHVATDLDGDVDLILDAGPCRVGIESTVVALEPGSARLLRPGGVPKIEVEELLGVPLTGPPGGTPQGPGMLASHYAPRATLRLEALSIVPGEVLLAFGPDPPAGAEVVRNLSPSGDLAEAAAGLYAALRELDAGGVQTIAVTPIPDTGLGVAINDRLRRAAAPRG